MMEGSLPSPHTAPLGGKAAHGEKPADVPGSLLQPCACLALEAERIGMRQAQTHLQLHLLQGPAASHLARFSVTLRHASCFLARFLAAASLAIFRPRRSLRPGSKIYTTSGMWVTCAGPVTCQAVYYPVVLWVPTSSSWLPQSQLFIFPNNLSKSLSPTLSWT